MYLKTFTLLLLGLLLLSCKKDEKISAAADQMRTLIQEISVFAKTQDPNFLIIPQNGMELCFTNQETSEGFSMQYMNSIDGIGIEALFFNEDGPVESSQRLTEGKLIGALKPVLVADLLDSESSMMDAFSKNDEHGFLAFPRAENNEYYEYIPSTIHNENSNNIVSLFDAQNYLYLISVDQYSTKSAFLSAIAATNFDVVIIDLFYDNEEPPLTAAEVASLKTKANGGTRLVIAYMNIGAAETYRYYWQNEWRKGRPDWIKRRYKGYGDEFWVEFWNQEWKDIIYGNTNSYTQKILDAGFDGAYLDNIESYYSLYRRR